MRTVYLKVLRRECPKLNGFCEYGMAGKLSRATPPDHELSDSCHESPLHLITTGVVGLGGEGFGSLKWFSLVRSMFQIFLFVFFSVLFTAILYY